MHLYFIIVKNVKKSVKMGIKNIRGTKDIKIGKILERKYIGKIF